jgi:hypothetical protein
MTFHEILGADEGARFEQYAAELTALQRARAEKSGKVSRALHVKQHLGAVGELLVTAPEGSRFGVFENPGQTWPLYVRFSNGSSSHQRDQLPDVRGLALKLVGVPGNKIIAGLEHEQTQDFLMIDTPAIPFRDPEEFMTFVRAAKDGPARLLPRLFSGFGFTRTLALLKRLSQTSKVSSYATHTFHSAAPIRFGDTAAKLALFPLDSSDAPATNGADALREDLARRLGAGPVRWALRAQGFVDDQSSPIEDTSQPWVGPWVELATLTLPKQDVDSARGKEVSELVSRLSFDPWHAIEAHRPLGAIMRARAVAYRESVLARKAESEPKSVLSL